MLKLYIQDYLKKRAVLDVDKTTDYQLSVEPSLKPKLPPKSKSSTRPKNRDFNAFRIASTNQASTSADETTKLLSEMENPHTLLKQLQNVGRH